jgi:hypothetical protein
MTLTYPCWRYDGISARLIQGADQEEAGWLDSPACFGIETAPGKIPDPEIAERRVTFPQADPPAADEPAAAEPKKKRGKA